MDNITVNVSRRKVTIITPCNPETDDIGAKNCAISITLKGDRALGAATALHFIGAISDDELNTVIGE